MHDGKRGRGLLTAISISPLLELVRFSRPAVVEMEVVITSGLL